MEIPKLYKNDHNISSKLIESSTFEFFWFCYFMDAEILNWHIKKIYLHNNTKPEIQQKSDDFKSLAVLFLKVNRNDIF